MAMGHEYLVTLYSTHYTRGRLWSVEMHVNISQDLLRLPANKCVFCHAQGIVDLWVMGIYGDLFSPGSFIINPCFDLWGFMGIYGDL